MRKKLVLYKSTDTMIESLKVTHMAEQCEKRRVLTSIIAHVDMDAFYASIEVRDQPSLRGRPVAVVQNTIIATANYEARKFGVKSALPLFIAKRLCADLVEIRADMSKYQEVSDIVMGILKVLWLALLGRKHLSYRISCRNTARKLLLLDLTRPTLISQVWMMLTPSCFASGKKSLSMVFVPLFLRLLKENGHPCRKTQLTCSAGIGCNKMLAKVETLSSTLRVFMFP